MLNHREHIQNNQRKNKLGHEKNESKKANENQNEKMKTNMNKMKTNNEILQNYKTWRTK